MGYITRKMMMIGLKALCADTVPPNGAGLTHYGTIGVVIVQRESGKHMVTPKGQMPANLVTRQMP